MLAGYSGVEANFLICNKKREELSFFSSVPPQGVAYTRTEWRRTNNLRTWFAIGFDFLSKSCLTSQTYLIYPIFYNNSVPKTLWTSAKVLHLTTVASSLTSFSLC